MLPRGRCFVRRSKQHVMTVIFVMTGKNHDRTCHDHGASSRATRPSLFSHMWSVGVPSVVHTRGSRGPLGSADNPINCDAPMGSADNPINCDAPMGSAVLTKCNALMCHAPVEDALPRASVKVNDAALRDDYNENAHCVVCIENFEVTPSKYTMFRCGHRCICEACYLECDKLTSTRLATCPICRAPLCEIVIV